MLPTRRLVALGAGAIALLLGGSLWLVELATRDPRARSLPRTSPAEPEAAPAPPPLPPPPGPAAPLAGSPPAGLLGVGTTPVVVVDPPPPAPAKGSWEAVPLSPRPAALGPLGAAVGRELNELAPQLSACFDEEVQARHGTAGVTAVRDAAPQADQGTTVLVLELEAQAGAVRIVDAPVETRGGASDGLIACAQRVLRGKVFDAPGARPGARHRMLHPLLP